MPANQDVQIGFWTARVPTDHLGYDLIYSTVYGVLQPAMECHVVDCSIKKGWPVLTSRHTAAELDARKARALQQLLGHLDA